MIPFALTEERPGLIRRNDLPPLPGGGLVIDSPSIRDKQRILGSASCSEFCKGLEALFKDYEGFKPGLDGLHLFDTRDNEISDIEKMNQSADTALSELDRSVFVWNSCTLGVLKLDSESFTAEKWWRRVILSTIYEIRFPKSRKQ